MPDALEELALSGVLFEPMERSGSRPHSPVSRTPSPNTDDEYFGDLAKSKNKGGEDDEVPGESIGMGPGRTGVKGVIRDRDEARDRARAKQAAELREVRKQMERSALTGKSFAEEEEMRRREKEAEEDSLEDSDDEAKVNRRWGQNKNGSRTSTRFPGTTAENGDYGHLREVGAAGYVAAVEDVDARTRVVVHLYHPGVDRCEDLDAELAILARRHVGTKFIRVRADAVDFALRDGEVDEDMLPTMQVYQGGELVYTWVRVDWEAGEAGVGALLEKHHIIAPIR